MKKQIVLVTVAAALLAWGCTKTEPVFTLKQSFEKGVADVNNAVSSISATKGYALMTVTNDPVTTGMALNTTTSYRDSITLKLVAGVYDFQPSPLMWNRMFFPHRLFKKTGTSNMLIVNLPEKLAFQPRYMHHLNFADSLLTNNFTISASDYHLYYNWWNNFDYKLTADFTLDSNPLGSLDVSTTAATYHNTAYSAGYTFTDGYTITTAWNTGDTSETSFTLKKDNDILLKETREFIRTDHHAGERQYTLTIGNVDIKKMTGVDSIQVYLNGVLQKKAAAYITDTSDTTGTIFHKRDILLTFDDGTTAKLSEMIDPALTALRNLVDSLRSMNFAKNIVDYIALSIYYNSHYI